MLRLASAHWLGNSLTGSKALNFSKMTVLRTLNFV